MQPIPSLWAPFGLRASPFFQDELRPSAGAQHPVSLFVGRTTHLALVRRRLVSDPTSRTIIEGAAGVGKTSFVNRLKADAAESGIASHEHPIRITSDTTWHSFVREALRALLRVRLGLGLDNSADAFWRQTVLMLEGGEMIGGGMSAAGFGLTVSRSRAAPTLPIDSLYEHFGEALLRMKRATGGAGVLLHVNNLENQALEHAPTLAILIRDLRDFLMLDGAHWAFVGTAGIEEKIFRVHDQVSGIFPGAIRLPPLTGTEVTSLLAHRYEHLALPDAALVPPVAPEAAARLYEYYQGDLRNFLRLLLETAEQILGLNGVRPMELDSMLAAMAPEYQLRLRHRLGEADLAHLAAVIARESTEFRVSEATSATKLSQPAATKLVERLVQRGAIRQIRTEGRSVYYRPTGEVLVAFAKPDRLLAAPGE